MKDENIEQLPGVRLDRVPPQNIDAERAVLGAMMLAHESQMAVPIGLEKIKEDAFYREAHRKIYKAIEDLFEKATPVDLATITVQLERNSDLEKVGGVPYLNEMIDSVPSAANLEYYIEIVNDEAIKRRLIYTSAQIYNEAFDDTEETSELVTKAQHLMMEVSGNTTSDLYPIKVVLKETFRYLQDVSQNPEAITGIPTGFNDLDAMTAGLQDGELSIVGGRPSMGKSSFVRKISEHVAVDLKKPVLLFSPEMTKRAVTLCLLGSLAGVSVHALRMGALQENDWPKLTIAAGKLSEAPIYIDHTASPTIGDIRTKAYQAKMRYGIELVIVDYIQKLIDPSTRGRGRQEEITSISNGLQALARELDVPVLVASQLSRQVENRPDKRPMMSDLRESGAIEQDADVVMFLYRENYYDKDIMDNTTEVIVRKQRNGPTGTIKLYFDMQRLRFENLARSYEEPF